MSPERLHIPIHLRSAVFAMASVFLLLLQAGVALLRAEESQAADLDHWKRAVHARFPRVPQLPTRELAAWLADTNRLQPVLLDVRQKREFAVGHIPGALQIDPGTHTAELRRLLGINPAPIVVYCSVGWRSSTLATRLIEAGMTNVSNLEGSAFAWANEDRPLEADGRPVTRVHPYNSTFGKLLRPEKRASP